MAQQCQALVDALLAGKPPAQMDVRRRRPVGKVVPGGELAHDFGASAGECVIAHELGDHAAEHVGERRAEGIVDLRRKGKSLVQSALGRVGIARQPVDERQAIEAGDALVVTEAIDERAP